MWCDAMHLSHKHTHTHKVITHNGLKCWAAEYYKIYLLIRISSNNAHSFDLKINSFVRLAIDSAYCQPWIVCNVRLILSLNLVLAMYANKKLLRSQPLLAISCRHTPHKSESLWLCGHQGFCIQNTPIFAPKDITIKKKSDKLTETPFQTEIHVMRCNVRGNKRKVMHSQC